MITIPIDPYKGTLYLTKDVDEYCRTLKAIDVDSIDEDRIRNWCQGQMTSRLDSHDFYVGWFHGDVSVLIHELTHVCLDLFSSIRADPVAGQEPFCYLLEHLTKTSIEKLAIKKKKQ